jgi:hypothetical protein
MTGILNGEVANHCADMNLLTDEKLFHLCRTYGENARLWKRKFAGLLPEVYKRRLYEKKHFSSIYEFAAKLAGMSHEQVRLVLSLEQKFEDKPTLHSLLVKGKVSANKLVRIAAIATTGNQEDLARITETLSNRALETFVRDEKRALQTGKSSNEPRNLFELMVTKDENGNVLPGDSGNKNGLQEPLFRGKSLHVQIPVQSGQPERSAVSKGLSLSAATSPSESIPQSSPSSESPAAAASPLEVIKLKLDKDILKELLELQSKNIDLNNLIRKMLNNRKAEIARAKDEVTAEINNRCGQKIQLDVPAQPATPAKPPSRYIPAKIRKIINEEQGNKCSMPGCTKTAEVTHHELPFAITKKHDPNNLKKLCKPHHELRHMINVKFYEHHTRAAASVHMNEVSATKCGYE